MRSLDYLKFEESSIKLGTIRRAEKREFMVDYNIFIRMKDLKNGLACECLEERPRDRLKGVMSKN